MYKDFQLHFNHNMYVMAGQSLAAPGRSASLRSVGGLGPGTPAL